MDPDTADPAGRTTTTQSTSERASATTESGTGTTVRSRDHMASNASAMFALQRMAGNAVTRQVVTNRVTIQRDRAEQLSAYNDAVKDGKWDDAAVRLNGFNDPDINARVKALSYEQRTSLLAACPDWNHRVRTPTLDTNFNEDVSANRLEKAATLLNGFSEADISSRFAKLPTEKHLALLIACPEWAKRVLEIGIRLQPKQKKREWPLLDYAAIWEKLHGRKMTMEEKQALAKGCIGITVLNLADGNPNPPLGLSFNTFQQALAVSGALNQILASGPTVQKYGEMVQQHPLLSQLTGVVSALPSRDPALWRAVVFSKRFYSNQNPDWNKRKKADPKAFKPDKKTGQVDMSGDKNLGRPDPSVGPGEDMVNFDYGWYDESNGTWWHANHSQPGMKVYESTLGNFSQPLQNFDRQVFSVAMAKK